MEVPFEERNEDWRDIFLANIAEIKQMIRANKIIQSMHITCIMLALEQLGELYF